MPVYIDKSQLCKEVDLSEPYFNLPNFYRKTVVSAYAYAYSKAFSLDIRISTRENKNVCSVCACAYTCVVRVLTMVSLRSVVLVHMSY